MNPFAIHTLTVAPGLPLPPISAPLAPVRAAVPHSALTAIDPLATSPDPAAMLAAWAAPVIVAKLQANRLEIIRSLPLPERLAVRMEWGRMIAAVPKLTEEAAREILNRLLGLSPADRELMLANHGQAAGDRPFVPGNPPTDGDPAPGYSIPGVRLTNCGFPPGKIHADD